MIPGVGAKCPNARRLKRVHPGGGAVGCTGRVVARIPLVVDIPLKTLRGMRRDFEAQIGSRVRKHGVRLAASILAACYEAKGASRCCPACGWSAERIVSSLTAASRRGRRA